MNNSMTLIRCRPLIFVFFVVLAGCAAPSEPVGEPPQAPPGQTAVAAVEQVLGSTSPSGIPTPAVALSATAAQPLEPTPTATWRALAPLGPPTGPEATSPLPTLTPTITSTPLPEDDVGYSFEVVKGDEVCRDLDSFIDSYQETLADRARAILPGELIFYSAEDVYEWPVGLTAIRQIGEPDFSHCFRADPDLAPGNYYAKYSVVLYEEEGLFTDSSTREYMTEGTTYFQISVTLPEPTTIICDVEGIPAPHINLSNPAIREPFADLTALLPPADREPITLDNASRLERMVDGGMGRVNTSAWSPDGDTIAIGTSGGLILYDGVTLREKAVFETQGNVEALAFNSVGSVVAATLKGESLTDKEMVIWDVETLTRIREFTLRSGLDSLIAWHPDGIHIAVNSTGGINIWNAAEGTQVIDIDIDLTPKDMAYDPQGRFLVLAVRDGVQIWAADGSELVRTIDPETLNGFPLSLSIDQPGTLLAVATTEGLQVLELATGAERIWIEGRFEEVAFSPDGRTLVGANNLFDVETGELLCTFYGAEAGTGSAQPAFSPDGSALLNVQVQDSKVDIWNVQRGTRLHQIEYASPLQTLAFSPDSGQVAFSGWNRVVYVLDTADFSLRHALPGIYSHDEIAFPSADTIFGTGGISLWDLASGQLSHPFSPDLRADEVSYSLDGSRLALANQSGELYVLDAGSGDLVFSQDTGTRIRDVAFHPFEDLLVTSGEENIVWDLESGSRLATIPLPENFIHAAFSPDGKILALGGQSQGIHLWDLETQNLDRTFEGGGQAVSFSPDGSMLAAIHMIGSIRVWAVESGELLAQLPVDNAWDLAFSPDGMLLVAVGREGMVQVWGIANVE